MTTKNMNTLFSRVLSNPTNPLKPCKHQCKLKKHKIIKTKSKNNREPSPQKLKIIISSYLIKRAQHCLETLRSRRKCDKLGYPC